MLPLAVFIVLVGAFFVWSAVANWDWYKGIADFAVAEILFGENAARILCAATGISIGVCGVLLAVSAK